MDDGIEQDAGARRIQRLQRLKTQQRFSSTYGKMRSKWDTRIFDKLPVYAQQRASAVELADLALGGEDHEMLIEEVELPLGQDPKTTTLRALDLGNRFRLIAVAVRAAGAPRPQFNPAADHPLAPGDHLMLMGLREDLDAFQASQP